MLLISAKIELCLNNFIGLVSIDTAGITSLMDLNKNLTLHGVKVIFLS
jgi:hypothetical protein